MPGRLATIHRGWHRLASAAAAAFIGCAASAWQAESIANIDEAMQPDFIRRDLALMQRELKLDAGQHAIIESLFFDYETAFREAAEQVRRQTVQLRSALGACNPDIEQRRELIRQRVAEIFEEAHQARQDSPEPDMQQVQHESQERAERLRDELRQFDADLLTEDDAARIIDQSAGCLDRWESQKTNLRCQFVADVLVTLDDTQREIWPALERQLNRDRMLPRGRLSGESADLNYIVRELRLPDEQLEKINALMEAYAARLDQALRTRDGFAVLSQRQLFYAMHSRDESSARSIIDRQINLRVAVRNLNDEWAAALTAQLEGPVGERVMKVYQERAYSRVFRPTRVQRLFNAVREWSDLKADEIESVEALQAAHANLIADANQRLLRVMRVNEPAELVKRALSRAGFTDSSAPDERFDPVQDNLKARDVLDERFAIQLRAALPPEQTKRLADSGAEVHPVGMLK